MADEGYSSTALQSIHDSEPPIPYHPNNLFLMHESVTASALPLLPVKQAYLLCWVDGYTEGARYRVFDG
jgi:hypothetical protein